MTHSWIRFGALALALTAAVYTTTTLSEKNRKLERSLRECKAILDVASDDAMQIWRDEQQRRRDSGKQ